MHIKFYKYSGSGNDFIVIDNREKILKGKKVFTFTKKVCDRKNGIGGDGVLLLENSKKYDFKMRIINADGSEAEMCGNGARCISHFAYHLKIVNKNMKFETKAGLITGEIKKNGIKVKLTQPYDFKDNIKLKYKNKEYTLYFLNTGVPHLVIFVNNIETIDVKNIGAFFRYHKKFQPAGTNVNFVKVIDKHNILIRTYERGVEDETLACGTGSTAGAIISSIIKKCESPVKVKTRGGEILKIYFTIKKENKLINIEEAYLEGKVVQIFKGELISL